MMDVKDIESNAEFMLELVKAQGVAVSAVSDGHVFMFKRSVLEDLCKNTDSDVVIIFVKDSKDEGTTN